MRKRYILVFVLIAVGFTAAACVPVPPLETQRSWTAAPITAQPQGAWETTMPGQDNGRTQPSDSPAALPTATPPPTRTPTRQPSPTPVPSPTPDPHRVVITEDDVRRSVASGAAVWGGAQVEGLDVRFTDGKMRLTADRLAYGVFNVSDLVLVGQLVARNGQVQMDVESVQPGGLVGAVIPRIVNQALERFASQWYVEDVQTLEGRLELRIR